MKTKPLPPNPKPILLRGLPLASGKMPAICAPLIGADVHALLAELALVLPKKPDVIEWRLDFFTAVDTVEAVIDAAQAIKCQIDPLPLLLTCRSSREGGHNSELTDYEMLRLYKTLCESGYIDLIDYEMSNDLSYIEQLRTKAWANQVTLVLSFHDFVKTPKLETLLTKFSLAEKLGADVAKVAVMPHQPSDVLNLLSASCQASEQLSIPIIGIAMGSYGLSSRLISSEFGSALNFAVAASSSAPGQLPIEDLLALRQILQRIKSNSQPPKIS